MTERRGRVVDVVLLVVGIAILLVVPHEMGADGEARYRTLELFVTTGKLESAKYSVVMPLFAAPLWALGWVFGRPREAAAFLNPILFVVSLVVAARELAKELAPSALRVALILLVYASMFPNHVQSFYGEAFTAVAVFLGVLWLSRERAFIGWAAILLGTVNTPATLVGAAFIAIREAARVRRCTPLLAPAIALALIRVESWAVRGSLFTTGYLGDAGFKNLLPYSGKPGFSYPWLFGLLAIFLSFGKGLVFFVPGLFVPMARGATARLKRIHGTLVVFVLGLVVVYAKWWAWYGGWFWGPRFFLVAAVPAALALAARTPPRATQSFPGTLAVLGAMALSFWVGVDGLVFNQTGLGLCTQNRFELEAFCQFVPEMSALWHPFVDFASSVPVGSRGLALGICAWWAVAFAWTSRAMVARLVRRCPPEPRGSASALGVGRPVEPPVERRGRFAASRREPPARQGYCLPWRHSSLSREAMDALGLTSRWIAAARERESSRPDRLFDDPFASAFAGDEGRAFLAEMEAVVTVPGGARESPFLAIRTRFFDDLLLAEAGKGVRQIALLAAGMDARALRLAWPEGTTVFEVERPDVLDYKERILLGLRAKARSRRIAVPIDLRNDWRAALAAAGHDATEPTAFLVEGLIPYLPNESAALAILSTAASIAAPGSTVGLDVASESFVSSPWMKTYVDALAARSVPWLFATDEPEALLERAGWRNVKAHQPGEPGLCPERWPYPVSARENRGVPRVFLVTAER